MGTCNQTANWGDEKFSSRLGSEAYSKPQGGPLSSTLLIENIMQGGNEQFSI